MTLEAASFLSAAGFHPVAKQAVLRPRRRPHQVNDSLALLTALLLNPVIKDHSIM